MSNTIGSNYTSGVGAYEYQKTQANKVTEAEEEKAAVQATDKKDAQAAEKKEDSFVKSPQYKPDIEKINAMKADMTKNVSAFKMMVQGMFQKQGNTANTALNALLKIDEATQLEAQAAIAEDGEWGVEQTANRILDFAKALSGGDSSKIGLLRNAFQQGYDAAEKIWGGALPDISRQTYDKVMDGFKQWEEGGAAETAEA